MTTMTMTQLVTISEDGVLTRFELRRGETTIGRSLKNDVVLQSIFVSRRHAVVTVDDAFVTLRDLDSQNGSFVNGERIESQVLVGGDVVLLGACRLQFFQSDQEFREIEARGISSVPDWVERAPAPSSAASHANDEIPTAREGPRWSV